MVHPISLATTYLQTFRIDTEGEHKLRSHATGFFVRVGGAVLLLTNWHVVSGLNPSNPSLQLTQIPSPHYIKVTVSDHKRQIYELTVPLYDPDMKPRWFEHPDGHKVDLAIIEFPASAAKHFRFADIFSVEDEEKIDEIVGRDVMVVGYPFSREELYQGFGEGAAYFLPVWKRGSIASEPTIRLDDRVILIDTLSRPGMSGAPVLMATDSNSYEALSPRTSEVLQRISKGEGSALENLAALDWSDTKEVKRKSYRLLGIYSGTIGSTKLADVALGKCWHLDVIQQAINGAVKGVMEYHTPIENIHYTRLLEELASRTVVKRDAQGNFVDRLKL